MKIPLVSICCITYNHEPYIRECLDGFVMQQANFPFEVLIHDDASTDATQEVIREYQTKYPDIIKPIYQTENQHTKGVRISIVFNFSRAQGKYIAMCEGDDYWTDPLKLQKQVDFLEANPEYSMCFHKAHEIREGQENFSPIFKHLKEGDYTGNEIIKKWIVPTASVVLRASIIHHVPVNPKFTVGDNVLWLTCARYGKIRCLNGEGAVYRMLLTGATCSTKGADLVRERIQHLIALKECFPEHRKTLDYLHSFILSESFYFCLSPLLKSFLRGIKEYPVKFTIQIIVIWCKIVKNIMLKGSNKILK